MEQLLQSNGVQYEHHNVLEDEKALEDLRSRGIKALPVTIIDDTEVIIGYFPKKLIPALKLDVKVDLSSKTEWLAEKYEKILSAAVRTTSQFTQEQLDAEVPWRPWTLRKTVLHIMSFPEVAYLSHKVGSMSQEDMRASDNRLEPVYTAAEMAEYGDKVRVDIVAFLNSGNNEAFDREVPAHYGGEVTVLELLNIILSHSTHHLKQVYHLMQTDLGITLKNPASEEDFEGIQTPDALF
ncbi:MAG: DinB family protein [Chloroflexi bacterium]|nr:DinB family protein [Chloroflexota bacterium]